MRYFFLLLLFTTFITLKSISQGKTITYIGEFRCGNDNSNVVFHWGPGQWNFILPFGSGEVYKKESYYPKEQGTGIIFRLDSTNNAKYKDSLFKIRCYSKIKSKPENIPVTTKFSKNISLKQAQELNPQTYIFTNAIIISEPEKLSLLVMLNHIYEVLYENNENESFLTARTRLDRYDKLNFRYVKYYRDSISLMEISKLLVFLEEYIRPGSYFLQEGDKLGHRIDYLASLQENFNEKGNDEYESRVEFIEDLNSSRFVHKKFIEFSNTLNRYTNQIQSILFDTCTINYNNQNLANPLPEKRNDRSFRRTQLAFGLGASNSTSPLYNVTISPSDSVQFQKVPRLNPFISTGFIYKIISWPSSRRLATEIGNTENKISNFSVVTGAFLNYYISSVYKQSYTSPIGLTLAIGGAFENLGLLGSVGFRTHRYPRDFFFQLNGQRLPSTISTLSVDDDRLFIDKMIPAVGLSFIYRFNSSPL